MNNGDKKSRDQDRTRKEIILVENGGSQQVQTATKFAVLNEVEDEKEADKQLVVVELDTVHRSPNPKPNSASNGKSLNPVAHVFNPIITRTGTSKCN